MGLEASEIESTLRMEGVQDIKDALRQLRHMERAALPELNRKRK